MVVVRFPVRIEAGAAVLLDGDELVEGLPVADNGGFSGGRCGGVGVCGSVSQPPGLRDSPQFRTV